MRPAPALSTSTILDWFEADRLPGFKLGRVVRFREDEVIDWLESHAAEKESRDGIDTYLLDGKRIHVLAEGRLVNLATPKGLGHPAEVMDLSFALQALCARYITEHGKELSGGVYEVPEAIDVQVADQKLASLGIAIDSLSDEQKTYLSSWDAGT